MSKQFLSPKRNALLVLFIGLAAFAAIAVRPSPPEQPVSAASIRVSVEQFNKYIQDWSEPEGYFDSDNFISNETSYQHVIDELKAQVSSGGVYLGVGPDQNFTYIAQTRPSLAVVVDIRRQNMLQHLLFKALFDLSTSRADYLTWLFAKEKVSVPRGASFHDVLNAVRAAPSSEQSFRRNFASVRSVLLEKYKLALTADDMRKIELVYRTFWQENLDLRFSSIGRGNALSYPTFESMLLETDRSGHLQNYLSSDDSFQWLKTFQSENRLIPIVGDFGGKHAFQAVAAFLKSNTLGVSTFYTSNVEFYLFGTPSWPAYMKNVHSLPLTRDAVFIRAYFSSTGRRHPLGVAGHRSTSLVHQILPFLQDYDAGRIPTYWEVVNRNR